MTAGSAGPSRRQCDARTGRGSGLDPIEFRVINDTQTAPDNPAKPAAGQDPQAKASAKPENNPVPLSQRRLIECLRTGTDRFGWNTRNPQAGRTREGRWMVGMGVAAAFRNNLLTKSAARVRLDSRGMVTVETDMTDIGRGSYTIIGETAAEMMGVTLEKLIVRLPEAV